MKKLLTFLGKKIVAFLLYNTFETKNVSLTNNVVSFEQPGPHG